MKRSVIAVLVVASLIGCKDKGKDKEAGGVPAKPAAGSAAPAPAGSGSTASPSPTPTTKVDAPAPAKVAKKELTYDQKTLCSEPGLMLTAYPYKKLQEGLYCDKCKAYGPPACEYDWPFNDVPPCREYDKIRNQIYAAYGYAFKEAEWQKEFAKVPWYKVDEHFDESQMSDVAMDNVAFLKKLVADKAGCAD